MGVVCACVREVRGCVWHVRVAICGDVVEMLCRSVELFSEICGDVAKSGGDLWILFGGVLWRRC